MGPEFGSEARSIMIVKKALYGNKSSGAAFRAHLAETLHNLGFMPFRADHDVWQHPAVKTDGFKYYEFILCYVDDLLTISEDATKILQGVQATFKFKDNKIEKPDIYLGTQLDNMIFDGIEGWTMLSDKCVKAVVDNIEETLSKSNQHLPTKC